MPVTPTTNLSEPSIEESLELIVAFREIQNAADRQMVIALAKRLSGGSRRQQNPPQRT